MTNRQVETFDEQYYHFGKPSKKFIQDYSFESRFPQAQFLVDWVRANIQPRKVLDVGCAKGFFVKAFRDTGIEAYGVDVSNYAVSNSHEDARPYLTQLDVCHQALPFEPATFDLVICLDVIEYFPEDNFAISEIVRVLKKGGLVLLTTSSLVKVPEDETRINIHNRNYWIQKFGSFGFKFVANKTEDFVMTRNKNSKQVLERLLDSKDVSSKNSFKLRLGKFFYQHCGNQGRKFVLWVGNRVSIKQPHTGSFIFEKGKDSAESPVTG